MRLLILFCLITRSAFGYWGFGEPESLVKYSDAIAVVNITTITHDRWEMTLARHGVSPLSTFASGPVEECLKGKLPSELTLTSDLKPGRWLLFLIGKDKKLEIVQSIPVEDGKVAWYGKMWDDDNVRAGIHDRWDDGRSPRSFPIVVEEIREMVRALRRGSSVKKYTMLERIRLRLPRFVKLPERQVAFPEITDKTFLRSDRIVKDPDGTLYVFHHFGAVTRKYSLWGEYLGVFSAVESLEAADNTVISGRQPAGAN